MNSNGADILNFTYFDVFRFPFPTSLTLKKVAVISHWHRDHLPVPSDVADFILLTPPGSNDIGPWFYEGKVTTIMQLPYDPVTMRDGRRFTLLPGYHAYYWLISWKNSAFLYVGDLNYGEVENVAKVLTLSTTKVGRFLHTAPSALRDTSVSAFIPHCSGAICNGCATTQLMLPLWR